MLKKGLRSKVFWWACAVIMCLTSPRVQAQEHSVAREWNEMLLTSIRNDLARPTVHARNLFHISAAMYDAWAIFQPEAATYLIGKTRNGVTSSFVGFAPGSNADAQIEEAISYAAYRLLKQRFAFSPGGQELLDQIDQLFASMGYNAQITSTDYTEGSAAALGNFIASEYLFYGVRDGSNEEFDYANAYYLPVNEGLEPDKPGNPNITDLNRWQPLALESFVDQSGNEISFDPPFLSPEWGEVWPFSLDEGDRSSFTRGDDTYQVYNDPGAPPYITTGTDAISEEFKWGFQLVSIWGAHLDPSDGVMWDISPASIGNNPSFDEIFQDYDNLEQRYADFQAFYKEFEGGDQSRGWDVNPHTGQPYPPNMVPRADYARVLAEFWADGPDSETPPGHWFTILNYVSDHPELEKRFKGQGAIISDLEWDLKAYFVLGGAMHDSAISAWSVKGWYDYIRPVSAIRALADLGQSTFPDRDNYDPRGIQIKEGYIEIVEEGDPLAGSSNQHVGKIKVYSWRGPDFIQDPDTDEAGVGWILAENWWPYQRPTFVTPPFAGYVSGHSTYSRAAAEVLTILTGDAYFPGGVGEFEAPRNEFLVFEEGPSVDLTLQWATYRDASDQTSLSRIWGGIHPPADDLPGRIIGDYVGKKAFDFADTFFENVVTSIDEPQAFEGLTFGPNPISRGEDFVISIPEINGPLQVTVALPSGQLLNKVETVPGNQQLTIKTQGLENGLYLIRLRDDRSASTIKLMVQD